MSAKWMRIETDFVDHPKVHRLAALLNEPLADAYVLRAWSWLSRFCPTGQVRDIDGTALETTCRWRGTPGALVAGLVEVGFLERLPDGGFEAHDWAEHQGKVAAKAEKERKRKADYRSRKSQLCPTDVPRDMERDNSSRPAQRDVTGRDVTGRNKDSVEPSSTVVELEDKLTDDEFSVFEHWRQVLDHPKAKATAERKRLIGKWLKVYSLLELQAAITGCSRSPHHMGQNERNTKYDGLELILRDAAHIEKFMALAPEVARVA